METVSNRLRDFSGQNIYVGMDVHHKSWKLHIYSDEFELKSFSQEPDVEGLSNYLKKHYPKANYQLAYEAGFCGFWIQRAFASKGINCNVVHAADVPTNNKEQLRKTDKVDSKKIAKGLKNGELNFIHVPDIDLELDRQLLRSREQLTKDSTRIKNRIKSILKLQGIVIPEKYSEGKWSKVFIKWLNEIDFKNVSGKLSMQTQINELVFLEEQKKKIDTAIKELSKTERYNTNVALLQTIPSIGLLTAMILLTEIGDINRFKRFDELCSYCGIVPNCHSSGEIENTGGLSRRGNGIIKNILIECAWVAVKKDPALLLYYKQQITHMKGQKAIIKVTRKLLSRIRYVLMNKKEYVLGIIE
ncbi:MAG: IS110 family transposase [Bacteroidota bacterium]|nr:IS110 family transposase [Bacteroidota bacterium]